MVVYERFGEPESEQDGRRSLNMSPLYVLGVLSPVKGPKPGLLRRGSSHAVQSFHTLIGKSLVYDDSEDSDGSSGGSSSASLFDDKPPALQTDAQKLEDLQAQAIFSLVETVPLNTKNGTSTAKLLFLTNRQAGQMNVDDIDKFTEAMDINPKPKVRIGQEWIQHPGNVNFSVTFQLIWYCRP